MLSQLHTATVRRAERRKMLGRLYGHSCESQEDNLADVCDHRGPTCIEAACSLRPLEGAAAFLAGHQPCDPLENLSISESVLQSMVT